MLGQDALFRGGKLIKFFSEGRLFLSEGGLFPLKPRFQGTELACLFSKGQLFFLEICLDLIEFRLTACTFLFFFSQGVFAAEVVSLNRRFSLIKLLAQSQKLVLLNF